MSWWDDAKSDIWDTLESSWDSSVTYVADVLPEYEVTGNLIQGYAGLAEFLAPHFYTFIGQNIATIIWWFYFIFALLIFAMRNMLGFKLTKEAAVQGFIFLFLLALNPHLGPHLWRGAITFLAWTINLTGNLIVLSADLIGQPLEPTSGDVTHPMAKLAALLDAQVGAMDDMGFSMMDNVGFWSFIDGVGATVISSIFGFLISFIYSLISFFYMFLLIRSHAFIMIVFIFSPILIPCFGLKLTRGIGMASLKVCLNALATIIFPSFALGIFISTLGVTQRLAGCIVNLDDKKQYKELCSAVIEQSESLIVAQLPDLTTTSGTISFYTLLCGIGLTCFVVIFGANRVLQTIFGGPNDTSPIAIVGASMAAIKTGGMSLQAIKKSAPQLWQGIKGGSFSAGSLAKGTLGGSANYVKDLLGRRTSGGGLNG